MINKPSKNLRSYYFSILLIQETNILQFLNLTKYEKQYFYIKMVKKKNGYHQMNHELQSKQS